ncbi:MAG: protein kinase [Rivularia sp. (in: cyanobacteria)]
MLPGHILRNRYKIIKQLGSGSFGITYLAEDLDLPDRPLCVVKNLRQSQNPEEFQAFIAFFNKEAKALYRLGNELDQIPRLFAHFEEAGEFYLVQEYIDGHDLSQEIFPGNKLSEAQVTQLLKEILEVLSIIHNKNIIHRDVKAQNLMRRNSDGKIVLIDFGTVKELSQLKANLQEQTNVSVIVGTNGYMPYEQSSGYPKLASDIYAVGMLGIYALTGVRPQELPKNPDTFEVIWQDKVSVSPALANMLDKMVRSNFKERYQTAGEALQGLTALSSRNFRFANQRFLIGVGVVVSLVFGIGLLFMNFSRRATTNVQLVCPEKPFPVLGTPDDKSTNNGKIFRYYDLVDKKNLTGKGILIISSINDNEIARYYGELKSGQPDGCGCYIQSDGKQFIGQFVEGEFQGKKECEQLVSF